MTGDRVVVQVELAPLAGAAPRPVERDGGDGERAVGRDDEARAGRDRCRVERPVLHDDARRRAVPGEEVAVDADDGRERAVVLLDAGERLSPEERPVRERGAERVQRAVRLRRCDDIEDDGAARGELHLALVRDVGHERLLRNGLLRRSAMRSVGGAGERADRDSSDEQLEKHDPVRG